MGRVFKLLMAGMLIGLFIIGAPVQAQNPCPANAALDQANTALNAGQYKEAITAFSCVIEANPQTADAYIGRSAAYLLDGDWFYTAGDYRSAALHLNRGVDTLSKKLDQRFADQVNTDPQNISAYIERAHWLWWAGVDDAAMSFYDQILALDPKNIFALTFRGSSRAYLGRQGAEDDWKRALEIAPNNAAIYAIIGSTYRGTGKYDLAVKALNDGLALNPQSAEIYRGFGRLYLESGEYQKAVDNFQQAIQMGLPPTFTVEALTSIGQADLMLNRESDANAAFTQAEATLPGFPWTAFTIGYGNELGGNHTDAGNRFMDYINRLGVDPIEGAPLLPGENPRRLDLTGNGAKVYRFPMELTKGTTINIAVIGLDNAAQVDPVIVLVDRFGTAVAASNDVEVNTNFDSLIKDFAVPLDGSYTLYVTTTMDGFGGLAELHFTATPGPLM